MARNTPICALRCAAIMCVCVLMLCVCAIANFIPTAFSADPYVVENTTQGKQYTSVASALDVASDGDMLALLADNVYEGALETHATVTLDLAGHKLRIEAASASTASVKTAFTYSGSGVLCICDSSSDGTGALVLNIGTQAETNGTVKKPYQCIDVSGGGTLRLSGCTVQACYVGTCDAMRSVQFRGALVSAGAFELADGATFEVVGNAEEDGFGALDTVGVQLEAGDTKAKPVFTVDASSKLSVDNTMCTYEQGNIRTPQTGTNQINLSSVELVEIFPEEGSDLANEIQEKFLRYAQFDGKADEDGYVYGTQVYYASQIPLDAGNMFWAFSEPVAAEDVGTQAAIKPDRIFVQSYYDTVAQATGVCVASTGGNVDIAGTVAVENAHGDAQAYDVGGGTWKFADTANTSAVAQGDAFRELGGSIDVRELFELTATVDEAVFYPKNYTAKLVATRYPVASAYPASSDTASVEVAGQAAFAEDDRGTCTEKPTAPQDQLPENVDVVFSGMKTSDGADAADVTATVPARSSISEAGESLPKPADYVLGGVTYRFVGWKVDTKSYAGRAFAPEALAVATIDERFPGAHAGTLQASAYYVPVAAGEYLVSFEHDGYVYAYGASAGSQPSYKAANAQATSEEAAKSDAATGYTYTFAGWRSAGATSGEYVASSALPAVSADAAYVAGYTKTANKYRVSFNFWNVGSAGTAYVSRTVTVAYGEDTTQLANAYAQAGDSFVEQGVKYTFLGWSTRRSDAEPLYTSALPAVDSTDSYYGNSEYYYGIYATETLHATVRFHVGDAVYATAVDVLATDMLDAALEAAGVTDDPADKSETETFRGWAASADATTILRGALTTVGSLMGEGTEVDLYAIYKTADDATDDPDEDSTDDDDDDDDDDSTSQNGAKGNTGTGEVEGPDTANGLNASKKSSTSTAKNNTVSTPSVSEPSVAASAGNDDDDSAASGDEDAASQGSASTGDDASASSGAGDGAGTAEAATLSDDGVSAGDGLVNMAVFFGLLVLVIAAVLGLAVRAHRNRLLDASGDEYADPNAMTDPLADESIEF